VVRTEAGYTYRIGQTVMRFAGQRRRRERGEQDGKAGQGEITGCLYLPKIAMVHVNTRMIPSVLTEAAWRRRMGQEDRGH
jgi:hypothetical protein